MCNGNTKFKIGDWPEVYPKLDDKPQVFPKDDGKYPTYQPWSCPKDGCPIKPIVPHEQCVLNKPLMIAIPAGQHIHISCPVHGDHILSGPNITL